MRESIPIGIVGAGRTRGGLGPFLAAFLEEHGFVVTGVSGRSLERAQTNAKMLEARLGHDVNAFGSPGDLSASGLGALLVSSPAEFHLEALESAVNADLPTLCEKPLIHENHGEQGAQVIEAFARKRLPLVENCQWPYALSAFFELHGEIHPGEQLKVSMGLGPPRGGRDMLQNTLSHLLSVIQALAPIDAGAAVTNVRIADPKYKNKENVLEFNLVAPGRTVEGTLHLEVCTVVPRPAWLAINDRRIDRRVGPGYSFSFFANGNEVTIEDPTKKLVNHFAELVDSGDRNLIDNERARIAQRLQWYRQILDAVK